MKKTIIITALILSVLSWQCSKVDQSLSLKESVELNTAKINSAFEKIAESKGYQLLSVTEDGTKTEGTEGFRDSIELDLIAGVYDFKPGTDKPRNLFFPLRLFRKTGENEMLIVNMPEKLAFHPRYLHFCDRADSVLNNNFTISATAYHFYYNWWNNYDYKLVADFTLDGEDVGNLDILSTWKSGTAGKLSRNFTFPEGYTIIKTVETGDTARTVFALTRDDENLLLESLSFTGDGFKRKERQYILSIGNVDIKRTTGIDSIQVFLNGVLQKKAGAKIIDNEDYNSSICSKRDILLSFDDGTTANLSDLISPAMETLKSLSKSLGEMYFSKQIVDYIAFSIYYNNH
jgi:archaellum component FlaG (FlaF/FlaG flagellin family)